MSHAVKRAGLPFVISTDWQITPEQLVEKGWVAGTGGPVVAQSVGTVRPSVRVIDYFVMSLFLRSMLKL
eukprot:2678840-Pyramimonas_sp.AAC.1